VALAPQILKIRRTGERDVSYPMIFLYLPGLSPWPVYGIMIRAGAVVAANGAAVCPVSICLGMKWKYECVPQRREKTPAPDPQADGSYA
jgi:hypothetical protein